MRGSRTRQAAAGVMVMAAVALLAACGGGSGAGGSGDGTPTPRPTPTPHREPPVVSISPDHGKVGTVVAITGTGFAAKSKLRASICAVDAAGNVPNYFFDCDLLHTVPATASASGEVHVSFTVQSIPHTIKGGGYHVGLGPITGPDPANQGGADFTVDR